MKISVAEHIGIGPLEIDFGPAGGTVRVDQVDLFALADEFREVYQEAKGDRDRGVEPMPDRAVAPLLRDVFREYGFKDAREIPPYLMAPHFAAQRVMEMAAALLKAFDVAVWGPGGDGPESPASTASTPAGGPTGTS